MAHTVSPAALLIVLAAAAVTGFEPTISPRLIDEAVVLGQSRVDSVRARFHQSYRLQIARAPIDYIDVVTPFRRVVLLTEERTQLGIRGFARREAIAALGDQAEIIELRVELTFHPQNTFVGVPGYDVELAEALPPARVPPQTVARIPRFGPRVDAASAASLATAPPLQPGGGGMPLTGGAIVASFPIASVNGGAVYDVVVSDAGKDLGRARVSFAGLR